MVKKVDKNRFPHQQKDVKVAEILEDLAVEATDPAPADGESAPAAEPVEISKEDLEQFISSVSELVKDKEAAEAAKKESEEKYLRLQADFDNFRKRTRQEKEDVKLLVNQELLKGLLPILDNFQRALEAAPEQSGFKEGVEMIYRQLQMFMEQAGVQVIEAVGQPFDPNFHEAILQEPVDEAQKGLVLMEMQTGYTIHGKLLRPSMVQVGV